MSSFLSASRGKSSQVRHVTVFQLSPQHYFDSLSFNLRSVVDGSCELVSPSPPTPSPMVENAFDSTVWSVLPVGTQEGSGDGQQQ